jgi:glycosyltransferase involved in cell wall biosynthesis
MPMAYALNLKRRGFDVLCVVDAKPEDKLCRPEFHYPEILYPYPNWIIEFRLPSQILLACFPRILSLILTKKIRSHTDKKIGTIFLNGFFASLASHIFSGVKKIGLSHGSDLDVWADVDRSQELSINFRRSFFKYIPLKFTSTIIKRIVERQLKGYIDCVAILYFPRGFNSAGDKVVSKITCQGVDYIQRYDASFVQLEHRFRKHVSDEKMKILSLVRFTYLTFPEQNFGYNKGNDIIIEGIAKYKKLNPNIEVHFVEKGEDVDAAKNLCRYLEIDNIVTWHKEMPFQDLVDKIMEVDICIDQVGSHWIGAGVYAMKLGVPLIANTYPAIKSGVWPDKNPVLNSKNPEDVCFSLKSLEDERKRRVIGEESNKFITEIMSIDHTLEKIFDFYK